MVNYNELDTSDFDALIEALMGSVLDDDQKEMMQHAHAAQKEGRGMPATALAVVLNSATGQVKRECKEIDVDPRAELTPGTYGVDCEVRIVGTFKVGEDYDQRIPAKADPWGLLATALSKLNGVTVESLVREHLEAQESQTEQVAAVKASAARAVERLKGATVTRCSGKVTSKLGVYVRS